MGFSPKEQADIQKSIVNFFKRIGDGNANTSEIAVFPHILHILVSDGRIQLSYHSNFNAS